MIKINSNRWKKNKWVIYIYSKWDKESKIYENVTNKMNFINNKLRAWYWKIIVERNLILIEDRIQAIIILNKMRN